MNALLRIRGKLADADIVDVLVDAPSDHQDGMPDAFRAGAEHAADTRAVIADVTKRYPGAKVYLIGTSRGTVSAAHLGVSLADVVAGTILTSTVTRGNRSGEALSRFDFASLRVPVLFIHHADDGCAASPWSAIQPLAKHFPVVVATGGLPPESGPCDPLAPHGFYGLDDGVVAVMRAFMLGETYPRKIS
jgi:pimeloyl-ACP methyl ester carboxylesterase